MSILHHFSLTVAIYTILGGPAGAYACKWQVIDPPPPSRFMSAAATSIDESIAYCGGTFIDSDTGEFGEARNQVIAYTPSSNKWTIFPNMTTKRSAPGAAFLDGRLYVFGGVFKKKNATHTDPDPTIKLDTVESIKISKSGEPMDKAWKKESRLPDGPLESPAVTSLKSGNGIVIAGGFNSWTDSGEFQFAYYNTTWLFNGSTYKRLPDMPFKRSNMALVATQDDNGDDTIFAFGGGSTAPSYATCASLRIPSFFSHNYTDTRTQDDDWIPCSSELTNPKSWMASGVINGSIILTGGMDGNFSPSSETDILMSPFQAEADITSDGKWSNAACDLPVSAGFLSGAVTSEDQFIVVAGAARTNGAYLFKWQ